MSALSIRRFEPSASAYEDLATLWTALEPEWPRVGRIWATVDEADHADGPAPRFVAYRGDTLVAAGEFSDPIYGDPGTYELSMFARPDAEGPEALARVHDAVMAELAPRNPKTLIAFVRDTRPWAVAFFEQRGYSADEQTAFSRLDVPAFDAGPFAERAIRVAHAGYRLTSAAALAEEGDAWKRAYWELDGAILADVPMLGGFRPRAFEDFVRDLAVPHKFQLDSTFLAMDPDGAFVGTSRTCSIAEVDDAIFAGLTGVLRPHRRRGVATALKLASIAHARENGYRWIHTLNEVANPMLALNEAMGFERRYTQLTMQRVLP
ncbi:MAG: hypothetical protein QNJ98_06395 [Planctomycetota bacterium]|nr:hypothetical protein [Planctomycetota bacterium]